MRFRDIGIIFVSVVAMYLALEAGNDFEVKKRWEVELKPTLYANGRYPQEGEHVPKPIIDDLDGDGVNELLVATRDPKLKIYDPSHPVPGHHSHSHGEMVLLMKSETTLLSKARVRSGRQPVAMATGHLLPATVKRRHKVIVVLTHDWTVMCFDHHLKLLWESNPMKVKLAHAYHREASISITPTKIKPFDTGLVVVGASMEYEDHRRLHRRKPKSRKDGAAEADAAGSGEEASRKRVVRNRIKELLGLPAHRGDDEWQVALPSPRPAAGRTRPRLRRSPVISMSRAGDAQAATLPAAILQRSRAIAHGQAPSPRASVPLRSLRGAPVPPARGAAARTEESEPPRPPPPPPPPALPLAGTAGRGRSRRALLRPCAHCRRRGPRRGRPSAAPPRRGR